jgi:hypothetical protein
MKVAGFGLIVAAAAMVAAQTGLIGFGVKDAEVKMGLAEAVIGNHLPAYPAAKLYYAATPAARVALVKAFLATAKAYSETAAFKADYDKHREGAKPHPPEVKGSADQQMSDQQVQQRKQLEATKAQVAKMPPEMQAQMKEMLKKIEEQLNKQASDPSQNDATKHVYEMQAQQDQERYNKSLAEWSADYPEQPDTLIAKRLKAFLALTADIDFDAKLETLGDGSSRFADPQYESKPTDWKLCYRAGREPVAAARAFTQDWLNHLSSK